MVSDAQLVERLRLFLRSSDLATTSCKSVRRQLESDFSVDLADRKPFIRDQVEIFLGELEYERNDEEWMEENLGSGNGEEESDEEEVKSNEMKSMKCEPKKPNEVKKRGGFTKLCTLSPHLQEVIGVSELTRPLVVKKLWEYVRENNLQNPSNRKQIICDDRLQSLFKANTIHLLQITKALSVHIWPLNSDGAAGPSNSKRTKKRERRTNGSKKSPQKRKKQKGVTSGFMAPIQLSDAGEEDVGVHQGK